MLELALTAFVTLFIVIDPPGMAPVFAVLTEDGDAKYRRTMAVKGSLIAALILVFFGFAGEPFLKALGISMDAFRAAGGFMLFVMAIEMVFEKRSERRKKSTENVQQEHQAPDDISVFPIAVPLLAGPGAITSILLLMSGARNIEEQGIIMGSMLVIILIAMITFMAAAWLIKIMGKTVANIITRVLGVVLAALAAQYMLDGIKGALSL